VKNPKSKLGFLGSVIPILGSEWSFAQLRITDTKCNVIFVGPNTIVAVSTQGNYYMAKFNPEKGGDCVKLKEVKVLGTGTETMIHIHINYHLSS
jgi:hypothetical protein